MAQTRLFGRALAASLSVGVAVTVAGCGNQNLGPGYANGSEAGPAYAHKALGNHELMPAVYAAATKAKTAHFRLSVTKKTRKGTTCQCMSATGDLVYGAAKPTMAMTVTQGGRRMTLRSVDGMLYLQVHGVTPPGRFIAIDPHDKRSAFARGFVAGGDSMDPTASLRDIASAVLGAERVGKQTLDGVTVEHYQVKIDNASLLHKAGYPAKAGGLPDTADYDLWLDQKHLIRRMSYTEAGMTFEETLSRWGEPVRIAKPAAGQLMRVPGV